MNNQENIIQENKLDMNNVKAYDLYDNNYETKALTVRNENGTDLFVPHETKIITAKPPASLTSLYTVVNGDGLGVDVVLEAGNFECFWRNELEEVPKTKTTPIEKITIKMHEIVSAPVTSRRMANLAQFDARAYMQRNVERFFIYKTDAATINGNGIKEPMGILSYDNAYNKFETHKLCVCKIYKPTLLRDLFAMETQLPLIYRNDAAWIISRELFNEIQNLLLSNSNSLGDFVRDGRHYRLFGRKVMIFDGLSENKKNIHCILINPVGYTVVMDPHTDVIENTQEIDLKLIFVRNFGGGVTDYKAIILGEFKMEA